MDEEVKKDLLDHLIKIQLSDKQKIYEELNPSTSGYNSQLNDVDILPFLGIT